MALPAPTCGLVEPVFCVQKKNWKQCGWTGGMVGMVGPGPWQEVQGRISKFGDLMIEFD